MAPEQYRVNKHGETSLKGTMGMAYRFFRFWVPMGGEKYQEGHAGVDWTNGGTAEPLKLGPLKGGRRRVVYP